MNGPLWSAMHARPRMPMRALRAEDLPHPEPGVYALYRHGKPMYVGLAEKQSLRDRVWGSHRSRGVCMTGSALRRNITEHLGIATAAAIKKRPYPQHGLTPPA